MHGWSECMRVRCGVHERALRTHLDLTRVHAGLCWLLCVVHVPGRENMRVRGVCGVDA